MNAFNALGIQNGGLVSSTAPSGFGDIFSVVKDVAGAYFNDRRSQRSFKASLTPAAVQPVAFDQGSYDPGPRRRGAKTQVNYQVWGMVLAGIGVLVAIMSLVKK